MAGRRLLHGSSTVASVLPLGGIID